MRSFPFSMSENYRVWFQSFSAHSKRSKWPGKGLKTFWLSFLIDLFGLYVPRFCFPISDHVMVHQGTISFKCRPTHVHPGAYAYLIYEKAKGKFHVVWIRKTKHTSWKSLLGLFGQAWDLTILYCVYTTHTKICYQYRWFYSAKHEQVYLNQGF